VRAVPEIIARAHLRRIAWVGRRGMRAENSGIAEKYGNKSAQAWQVKDLMKNQVNMNISIS